MDVMVFCPVLRLEPETVRAMCALEWDGPLTVVWQRDNPEVAELGLGGPGRKAGYRNHLHQYQRGREVFLKGGYDAMLVIESDIIPPADTLKRLAALPADVAYGVYCFRGMKPDRPVVNVLERYYGWPYQAKNVGDPLTVRGLYAEACRQRIIDCSGSGLGCVLIHRKVVEEVPFEAEAGFFDTAWTQAVYRGGYRMMADMAVRCGHVEPSGVVLWPPF